MEWIGKQERDAGDSVEYNSIKVVRSWSLESSGQERGLEMEMPRIHFVSKVDFVLRTNLD